MDFVRGCLKLFNMRNNNLIYTHEVSVFIK